MVSKFSVAFMLAASLIASASTLDERQTGCVPAAENCAGGKTCCSGLFCSTTEPNVCSKCIPSAEFCTGVPCCAGLFCGFETEVGAFSTHRSFRIHTNNPLHRPVALASLLAVPAARISHAAADSAAQMISVIERVAKRGRVELPRYARLNYMY
ncbi:hypothetical protein B0H12DRAFT_1329837 [Mycena haematopus]|nr:hypothetical protein B0H12DRAFT_1329837 [Mycena haematopus]